MMVMVVAEGRYVLSNDFWGQRIMKLGNMVFRIKEIHETRNYSALSGPCLAVPRSPKNSSILRNGEDMRF